MFRVTYKVGEKYRSMSARTNTVHTRTNLAFRSSLPDSSFLFSTNGNLLLTTIMLPLEVKLPVSVNMPSCIFFFVVDIFDIALTFSKIKENERKAGVRYEGRVSKERNEFPLILYVERKEGKEEKKEKKKEKKERKSAFELAS